GSYDIAVIGGGIVGAATAREIKKRNRGLSCVIIEKELDLAMHQSGHNSGVIHAGIYYKPGSIRAKLCTEGLKLSYKYFDDKKIPYKKIGKLIVATDKNEEKNLLELYKRGNENNVKDLRLIDGEQIKEIEPYCTGVRAIHSPHTGIVDWGSVTKHYGKDFKEMGGDIHYGFEVNKFDIASESVPGKTDILKHPVKSVNAGFVLACCGLYSDKIAVLSGGKAEPAIVPVRGEYLKLIPEKEYLVKGNIYPVPDPRFPFLGVHFTPRMDGSVWLGPNAVVAFKREGYGYFDLSLTELIDTLKYKGFQKLAFKFMSFGVKEFVKSAIIQLQARELQKYIPSITPKDIVRGPSGVRAQALDTSGNLIEDFIFDVGTGKAAKRILHCRNAPSPAATSSLAIANVLADKVLKELQT
ncbi:hypothetical protein AAG570_006600, partial [Ranatra chinensis]